MNYVAPSNDVVFLPKGGRMLRKLLIGGAAVPILLTPILVSASSAHASSSSRPIETMATLKGAMHQAHRGTANMTYHGGQIESAPAIYLDFWGSWWNTTTTTGTDGSFSFTNAEAMQYLKDFYTNVGGSSWENLVTQYCQGVASGTVNCGSAGTHIQNLVGQLKGVMVDATNSVPSSPTQSQIAAESAYAGGQFGLPAQSQAGATVIVFTPSGNSMSGFGTQWCAWHSVTTYKGGNLPYAYMPYQPSAGTSCGENFINQPGAYGNGYFDGFSVVGGHEYAEAETDPVTASRSYAWYDGSGNEIGDKCAWSSQSGNITLGSHSYAVQPLWSNSNSGCVL